MAKRTLLVISARLDAEARAAVASGRWPRKDFLELERALDADVIDYGSVEGTRFWRAARRIFGMPVTQACMAVARSGRYDQIFTDGEHIGIPLAVLLRFARRRPRHVTIGHLLVTPAKRAMFRWLRPHRGLDAVIAHATVQRRLACAQLGLSPARVSLVPYQIDPVFWVPREGATEEMICSAGLEYRDYPTLLGAVRGLPLRVVIAAGSRWSAHRSVIGDNVPPNVEVISLDYEALRDLYARARFVVVPLHEVDNQAGITVILEAMAMAKAVIVTATRGQCDVVRGRMYSAEGLSGEAQGGPAAFGVTGPLAEGETGLYVPPGDAAALRGAIQFLLDHPDEAARMGAAGRRLAEEQMSLDLFVRRVKALVEDSAQSSIVRPAEDPPRAARPHGLSSV